MTNKSNGSRFEREFAQKLFEQGFWVHLLQQNVAGQPADLIALKGTSCYLIDCKDCRNDSFPLSRIEANQWSAMKLIEGRSRALPAFALKLSDGSVYILYYWVIELLSSDKTRLTAQDIRQKGIRLEEWLNDVVRNC